MLERRKFVILFVLLIMMIPLIFIMQVAFAQTAEISGFVWNDKNIDGLFQNDEPFITGVKVTLLYRSGDSKTTVKETKTESDGRFSFKGLNGGEYMLAAEVPDDCFFTILADSGNKALPASGNKSATEWFTLSQGEVSSDQQIIGITKYDSYVVFYAFEDVNTNGGRFSTEPLLKNVRVELLYENRGETVIVASANTNNEGVVAFRQLTPAAYRVSVTLPEMYVIGPMGLKLNTFYNCIPPTETNYGISDPFEVPAKGSIGLAVGAVKTGSAEGKVWYDGNFNGLWDDSENGYAGVEVILENPSMNIIRKIVTNTDGRYSFLQVQPGAYALTISLPKDTMFTIPGGDSIFSDAGFSQTTALSITSERITAVQSAGVMPVTSFELIAFHDTDVNGRQDENDPAFAGAQINIYQNGKLAAHSTTNEQGVAFFPVLRSGDISVQCILPDSQVFTVENEDDENNMSSLYAVSDLTVEKNLPVAQHTVLKAGITVPSSVTGQVFDDSNNNGVYNTGETILSGITVQALNKDGVVVVETVTSSDGKYKFDNLLPAPHTIRFILIDPYIFSANSQTGAAIENTVVTQTPAYGDTDQLSLLPGYITENINAGIFKAGVISGYLLLNANHDNLQTTEGGISGVHVELIDEHGLPYSDYTIDETDKTGYFYIKGVLPGTYSLRYILPENAAFSLPMTDSLDYRTNQFGVKTGDEIIMPNLGAVYTGNIFGMAWQDVNANGLMDADEKSLSGIKVNLLAERSGAAYEIVSQSEGLYSFSSLRPDTYTLTVELPQGMVFTNVHGAPIPAVASNVSKQTIILSMGQNIENANVGTATAASLTGRLYYDLNNNNLLESDEYGYAGAFFQLSSKTGPQILEITTDTEGNFSIPAMIPGEYILRLPLDNECVPSDGSTAKYAEPIWEIPVFLRNGEIKADYNFGVIRYAELFGRVWSMDGTANGINSLRIQLYAADNSDIPVQVTDTDSDGNFSFKSLKPGMYSLAAIIPENYRFARKIDTSDRTSVIQSNPNAYGEAGSSEAFVVPMGESLSGYDIGIGAMGKLGDTAWLDTNGNGMQDGGEPGMPGIIISLYQYQVLVAETTTDLYGRYLFTDLYPGIYDVTVQMHPEIKSTVRQTAFPLVASVLPESGDTTVTAIGIIVPSGGRNMNCDLGFVLRSKNKYPAVMDDIPTMDWSPINLK